MSQTTHKTSFLITLALLFLLPIFFVPGGALYLDSAKSALLVFGLVFAVLVFLSEIWKDGRVSVPWHPFVLLAALLPTVYFLSAILSTPSSLSLFGYSFEVGTFGFMLFCSALLILVALIFSNTSRVLQALAAFFISISILAVFIAVKILSGGSPVWGVFSGNMGNPLGNWTDLSIAFGLLSVFAALTLGMLAMKLSARILLYAVFILSTSLLVIISFPAAFLLTLGASIFLLFYFKKTEKKFFSRASLLPLVLALVSLIFLINPTISKERGTLSNVVAATFKIENTDIRPSLSATLGISKAVLSQVAFLGSGPNTFGHDWLIYKPVNVNTTPFWSLAFPFGIGFIPTQIASTGILGSALWFVFFAFLVVLGLKSLSHVPESRAARLAFISVFLITFFLWVSSFLYTPSGPVLLLAFFFSGLAVAVSRETGIIPARVFDFKKSPQTRVVSILFLVLILGGALYLGWLGFGKTASAYHFKKAVDLSNIADTPIASVEDHLNKALNFAPADVHYVALSRIYFAKAQAAANNASSTPEANEAIFEESMRNSIESARMAVSLNPAGYQNWVALGMIYSSLVPKPLSVEGAYENASYAYSEASKRNPANPELPLLFAQLELNKGDTEAARSFIRSAIALKEDYADAYSMLVQLEISEKNIPGAIASTERLAVLMPDNAGIYFELGLLKYSNKDYAGAEKALNLALTASPDYANAKYYLGLTLAQLGKIDEALKQFEDLSSSNPESEEVRLIIEQLKAGKVDFLNPPAVNTKSSNPN